MQYDYHVVDVFTSVPLEGNALAVFPDARGLDAAIMQRIARELNLSETTFVFPAEDGAAAKVRIFTPAREMEFAGHPTIGTAYVLRALGIVPPDSREFLLEENIGRVPVRVDSGDDPILWLKTPPISREGVYDRAQCARALSLTEDDLLPGVPSELYTAGNPNIFVPLRTAAAVDAASVDSLALRELLSVRSTPTCIFPFAPTPQGAYSRMFAPELGIIEDPATGSATGPLAAFMMDHGLASRADGTRFISEQGTKMGRRSILHVLITGERGSGAIEVGGNTAPVAVARITLTDRA
ncbi:MAG TPA: PhzF family phenazine biosynthesis protein [Candidatus Baltobacteraceae bacterium]|nr:PhzF family phenazine biosynthesis protein [Candidatus Baltobacteraceae bacterium]